MEPLSADISSSVILTTAPLSTVVYPNAQEFVRQARLLKMFQCLLFRCSERSLVPYQVSRHVVHVHSFVVAISFRDISRILSRSLKSQISVC